MYSFDLRDIARQAEGMLSDARKEADRLIHAARTQSSIERESVRQSAQRLGREQGIRQGWETGRSEALQETREKLAGDQAPMISALSKLLEEFGQRREQMYLAARRDVVVLAIAIARRIVSGLGDIEEAAPQAAAEACAEALELLKDATDAVVRIHPDDWDAVSQMVTSLADSMQSSPHVRVEKDPEVGRGGVVVETGQGTVDATAASRVDRIADELVTHWRQRMKELSIES
jgi:flagellar assembly protein FliH